ncbi:MAG: SCO family protein [Chloroflexota bacterium]
MASKRNRILIITLATLLVAILGVVGWRYRPYSFHGMVMKSAELAPNFTLISSRTGEPVQLRDFRGQVVLLYFGYTTCPDVCPATLSDVAQAFDKLGRKAEQVQLLWITVDPERDTPLKMQDYVLHFDPDFLGLVPRSAEETLAVATQYGIYYEKRDYGSATGYLMDHTATITLIDKDSYVRVVYPFGTTPEDLAADLEYILSRW